MQPSNISNHFWSAQKQSKLSPLVTAPPVLCFFYFECLVWQSIYFTEHVRRAPKLKSKSLGMLLHSSNTPTSVSLHCLKARRKVKVRVLYSVFAWQIFRVLVKHLTYSILADFLVVYNMFCILTLGGSSVTRGIMRVSKEGINLGFIPWEENLEFFPLYQIRQQKRTLWVGTIEEGNFLSMSQQAVSADIIPNSGVEKFSLKTGGKEA